MNIIKNLPLAISGLNLAILSLGKIFVDFKDINLTLGSIIILLILLKFILYNDEFKSELNSVISLSSFGTFSMSLMLFSTYLMQIFPSILRNLIFMIWILGVLGHILLIIVFTKKYVLDSFNIEDVFATWWIVYIGITMAAITAPVFDLSEYAYIFFSFGFLLMIPTLILITYRHIKYTKIDDKNKPFICIYPALLSILTVGYINALPTNTIFLSSIYITACIFYIFGIYNLIKYLFIEKLNFTPSFSGFTFPFVISTIATIEAHKYFQINILKYLSQIQSIIALSLVIFVLYKYLEFLFKIGSSPKVENKI